MFRRLPRSVLTPHPRLFWGICLLGFSLAMLLFQPGYLTVDGVFQYMQAQRIGIHVRIDDWHTPVMAWVWRRITALSSGTFGMFVLQQVLIWAGLSLISWRVLGPTPLAGVCVLLMTAFPPVLANLAPIWKDIQMGGALLLGVGLLLYAGDTRSREALLWAQLPLLYGLMLRHNALGALLPLHVWGAAIALRIAGRPLRPRVVVLGGVGLLCAHLLVNTAFTSVVIKPLRRNPLQYVMLHDLAAISLARGEALLPPYLVDKGFGLKELRDGFLEDSGDNLVWRNHERILSLDPAEWSSLRSFWLRTLIDNPGIYVEHRWRVLRSLLAIGRPTVHIPFATENLPEHLRGVQNAAGLPDFHPSRWNARLTRGLEQLRDSLFFRPWLYVLLAAAGGLYSLRLRAPAATPARAIAASGLLYMGTYVPFAPAADFRYVWWLVLTVVLLPLLLWRGASKGQGPALTPP